MPVHLPPRVPLAVLPTPLERADRLSEAWGGPTIWVKRDDLTGFELSGNKVRKLEFHLAAALQRGASTVITCGAVQSNHCRATALAAARVGLGCRLLLRSRDGARPETARSNHLLDLLAGAEIDFITPEEYERRDDLMAALAEQIGSAWVIPEGASDWLGMFGFVVAMMELVDQISLIGRAPAAVWHASSSAGTTAGLGWGAHRLRMDVPLIGMSVGEAASDVVDRVRAIWADACARMEAPTPEPNWEIVDDYVGGGYGITTPAELRLQAEATALTGMVFDPTYTGKALYGLHQEIQKGRFGPSDDVVFWHTGGGFAALAHDWSEVLG